MTKSYLFHKLAIDYGYWSDFFYHFFEIREETGWSVAKDFSPVCFA